MEQARDLAKGLHPVDLDAGGLVSSLEELAEATQKLFGIRCTFKCDRPIELENTEVAAHLYRMTQEAITNAIKHGKAKNIQMVLAYGKDESTLTIKSDGLDFPKASRTKGRGMGLQIMGHRADIIGGSLDIHKAAGGGTIVICRFPNLNR
jgi:signal transduction histidine kinase